MIEALQCSLWIVNDRAGQNRARPNRAGSVDFTEGSAEPARFGRSLIMDLMEFQTFGNTISDSQ